MQGKKKDSSSTHQNVDGVDFLLVDKRKQLVTWLDAIEWQILLIAVNWFPMRCCHSKIEFRADTMNTEPSFDSLWFFCYVMIFLST